MKTIYLKGDVGFEITAENVLKQIDIKSTEKLRVVVNSPGGFVFEAFEIYNIFKSYKGKIEMVLMPYAASAASYIVMAGDTISAFKNSIWMAHRVSSIAIGDADEMMREAEIMQSLENVIIEAYQSRIAMSKDEMKAAMKNEMWLIGWEQLTERGMIDNIIDDIAEIELPDEEIEDAEKSVKESEAENFQSFLKMRIAKSESRMKSDNEKIKNMYERVAAKLEITPEKIPDDNNIQGDKMNLQDFLKSNPEAMAEYNQALETAKASGADGVQAQIQADRERLAKILKLENAKISAAAESAIIGETPVVDYLEAKLLEQENIRTGAKKSPFSEIVANQTPAEQDKVGAAEQKNKGALSDEEFEAKLKAYREARAKKNGGK